MFTFDDSFLSRPDFSHNRFQFFLETLIKLRDDLREAGGDLLVLSESPDKAFGRLKSIFEIKKLPPPNISWSRDYEPFARARDERMGQLFMSWGWETSTERDHLLFEPHEIKSLQGTPYKVFTPFAKQWFQLLHSKEGQKRIAYQATSLSMYRKQSGKKHFDLTWEDLLKDQTPADHLDRFLRDNGAKVTVPIPAAGFDAAMRALETFQGETQNYGEARDMMAEEGTSKLSLFLKNGSITPLQVIASLGLETETFTSDKGSTKFLKQLAWRDFYYHILWHFPFVEKESFNANYRNLNWENDPELFEAWKAGKTGFPIVDAAMRQLSQTGWMHNRARMVVASFLTKDLLIDWRWGENWFMNQLLDGDLAPNNGGWQWAASTGCDPQPYFRIFNPLRQSERFDPSGDYIKRYVPELRNVSGKEIHNPGAPMRQKTGYPSEIVSHKAQAIRAQMLFKR